MVGTGGDIPIIYLIMGNNEADKPPCQRQVDLDELARVVKSTPRMLIKVLGCITDSSICGYFMTEECRLREYLERWVEW